jgi:hypothetical protein
VSEKNPNFYSNLNFCSKTMDCPIIPLVSLTVSCCLFGLAYFDVAPYSTGALLASLAFSIASAFTYWCVSSGHLKTSEDDAVSLQNTMNRLNALKSNPILKKFNLPKQEGEFIVVGRSPNARVIQLEPNTTTEITYEQPNQVILVANNKYVRIKDGKIVVRDKE